MGRLRRVHHRLSLRAMALVACLCACPASSAWLACHLCVCSARGARCVHAACVHVCAASSRHACLCACPASTGRVQAMQHPWPSSPACVRVLSLSLCAHACRCRLPLCVRARRPRCVLCVLLFSVLVRVRRRVDNDTSSACACVHSVNDASHACES